jgi:hypothetical protein
MSSAGWIATAVPSAKFSAATVTARPVASA